MQPPLRSIPPDVVALADYERLARERLAPDIWAYLAGGGADELTLRSNREAFDRIQLRGRVLSSFPEGGHTRIELFGRTLAHPLLIAPVALHRLAHPDGELATVLGAAATQTPLIVSTQASVRLEDIAQNAHGTPLWFQLYLQPDRAVTTSLIRRAEAAGYEALVVTVDAAVNGVRNREQRAQFRAPPGVEMVNLSAPGKDGLRPFQEGAEQANAIDPDNTGVVPSGNSRAVSEAGTDTTPSQRSGLCNGLLASAPTWADIAWLRSLTKLPILLKGIMDPADAALALEAGIDGIIVSNHGGRALDTLPATIDVLPSIVECVNGRVPVLMDGGIRRGTDVLKALALGANAVLVGRPCIHGLATAGAIGVAHTLRILRGELEVAMALTGCATPARINASILWK